MTPSASASSSRKRNSATTGRQDPGAPTSGNRPQPSASAPFRAASASDILGYIPYVLGYVPRESLVLLTMTGKRFGATLRLDLPPAAVPDDGAGTAAATADRGAYAANVCRLLDADTGADGTLLMMYTDMPWTDPAEPPLGPLVATLKNALGAAGIPLRDGWLISSARWRNYFCDDPSCCAWPGNPLDDISSSRLSTELVYRGNSYSPSLQAAVAQLRAAPWPCRGDVLQAWIGASRAWEGRWLERRGFVRTLQLWDAFVREADGTALRQLRATPVTAGYLLASLESKAVRDSLLVLASMGLPAALTGAEACGILTDSGGVRNPLWLQQIPMPPAPAPAGALPSKATLPNAARLPRHTSGTASPAAHLYSMVLVGSCAVRPDWKRLDRLYDVLGQLAAVAEGQPRAALLTMLAWIEWVRGRGSRAHQYLQECLAEAPDYTLATLLRELLGRGCLSEWTRVRENAWQDGGPAA